MAINKDYKLDLVYKKIGYGTPSTTTDKAGYEESITSPIPTYDKDIWAEASKIPASPIEVTGLIKFININMTEDLTVPNHQVWTCNYIDFIPPTFGADYVVKVFDNQGNRVFPTNANFFFDYTSGTLIFPEGAPTGYPFSIECYQYIGKKGFDMSQATTDVVEIDVNNVLQNEKRSFWLPLTERGYITGIKCIGDGTAGDFYVEMLSNTPSNDGQYIYASGLINKVLWDIMTIPFVDETGYNRVYVTLDNRGAEASFNLKVYIKIY